MYRNPWEESYLSAVKIAEMGAAGVPVDGLQAAIEWLSDRNIEKKLSEFERPILLGTIVGLKNALLAAHYAERKARS